MRFLASLAALSLMSGVSYAGPVDDSQMLYDALAEYAFVVQDAVEAPVSRKLARELESTAYQPIKQAWEGWESARSASGEYRSYTEFESCKSAGQLLGYVTDEVIQHHLGNDQFEGSMKYRHAQPFVNSHTKCKAQIEAARAEMAAGAEEGVLAGQ